MSYIKYNTKPPTVRSFVRSLGRTEITPLWSIGHRPLRVRCPKGKGSGPPESGGLVRGAGARGGTDVLTDRREFSPVFYRTSWPSGSLPKRRIAMHMWWGNKGEG